MVVDDEGTLREMLRMQLEEMGYQVYVARDGDEALDLLKSRVPGLVLVILDMMLPKKNGEEVLRWIRKEPRTRHLPVLILSAYPLDEDQQYLLALGAVHYIEKSEGLSSLFDKIPSLARGTVN